MLDAALEGGGTLGEPRLVGLEGLRLAQRQRPRIAQLGLSLPHTPLPRLGRARRLGHQPLVRGLPHTAGGAEAGAGAEAARTLQKQQQQQQQRQHTLVFPSKKKSPLAGGPSQPKYLKVHLGDEVLLARPPARLTVPGRLGRFGLEAAALLGQGFGGGLDLGGPPLHLVLAGNHLRGSTEGERERRGCGVACTE